MLEDYAVDVCLVLKILVKQFSNKCLQFTYIQELDLSFMFYVLVKRTSSTLLLEVLNLVLSED
jgi:hypothetical protein